MNRTIPTSDDDVARNHRDYRYEESKKVTGRGCVGVYSIRYSIANVIKNARASYWQRDCCESKNGKKNDSSTHVSNAEESEATAAALEASHRPEDYHENDGNHDEQREQVEQSVSCATVDVSVVHGRLNGREQSNADENGDEDSNESHNPRIHGHRSLTVQVVWRVDSPP